MPGGTAIGMVAGVWQGVAAVCSQGAYASSRSVSLVGRGADTCRSSARLTCSAWRVIIELEPLICERQLLHGHVTAVGIEIRGLDFNRQPSLEHPSDPQPPSPPSPPHPPLPPPPRPS